MEGEAGSMDKLTMVVRGDGVSEASTLEVQIHRYSSAERLKKTLKWFGIFLGIGLVSALIPVVHFVAVPTFALLALGSLVFVPLNKQKILSARAKCPYCGKDSNLTRVQLTGTFRDSCEHCRQLLHVEPLRSS